MYRYLPSTLQHMVFIKIVAIETVKYPFTKEEVDFVMNGLKLSST